MKIKAILTITTLVLIAGIISAYGQGDKTSKLSGQIMVGYNRGIGFQASVSKYTLPSGLHFGLRVGMGYTILDPGNALDARRIFINNNTNGVPEKSGHAFDFRLDFLKARPVFGISNSYFVFGPRFSTFSGDFVYVGGNEDFEVKSKQWGAGAGFEHHFGLSSKVLLVVAYGLDLYAPSRLYGHDTSYSPWGEKVNPNNDNENGDREFRYWDADKAIRQPEIMPHVMIGLEVGL